MRLKDSPNSNLIASKILNISIISVFLADKNICKKITPEEQGSEVLLKSKIKNTLLRTAFFLQLLPVGFGLEALTVKNKFLQRTYRENIITTAGASNNIYT